MASLAPRYDPPFGAAPQAVAAVGFWQRLSVRQAAKAVLAALVIGVVFSGIQIASDYVRESNRIDSLIQQVAGVTEGSASAAAYTLDSGYAGQVVNGLMAYGAIHEVRLSAEFDRLLAKSSRPLASSALTWLTARLFGEVRVYDIPLRDPGGNEIGALVIQVDTAVVGLDFLSRSAVVLVNGLLRNLLLAAVLILLFYFVLTKPFLTATGRIRGLDPERPGGQVLTAPPGHEDDELGMMVRAVERLRGNFTMVLGERDQEIAERKRAEEALRLSEANLASAQRIAHLGSYEWDIVGDGLAWSDEAFRIFGLDKAAFRPTEEGFVSHIHPDDRAAVKAAIDGALEQRGPYDIVFRIRRHDGEERRVRDQGEVDFDRDDKPLRMRGAVHDITEQSRAEEEVRKLNDELEQRVERRTAELRAAQEELLRKERLAALGQLTATVSHELRNPLGAMRTGLEAVRRLTKGGEPMLERTINVIDRSVTRCDNIIGDLLDFSRVRPLDAEPTALDDWLAESLDEYEPLEGVALRRELACGARVAVDRDRFRQVLVNLLDNACQAVVGADEDAPRDGAKVVTVASRLAEGRAEIVVSDTGPGIAPEIEDKVFDPLYSTKTYGVGLGLTIVRRIVEQHDGEIEVESEPGAGVRVTIRLPVGTS